MRRELYIHLLFWLLCKLFIRSSKTAYLIEIAKWTYNRFSSLLSIYLKPDFISSCNLSILISYY